MFARQGLVGWQAPIGQMTFALLAIVMVIAPALVLGEPLIAGMLMLAPLFVYFMTAQTFLVCVLFVTFSLFRIHEAYPLIEGWRLPLIFGGASLGGLVIRAFSYAARGQTNIRELKTLAIGFALLTIGIGIAMSAGGLVFGGSSAGSALGALMFASAAATMIIWYVFLQRTLDHKLPLEILLFAIFFCMVTLGAVFSRAPIASGDYWASDYWKIAAMTLAIAWLARKPSDFAWVSWLFIIAGVLVGLVAIYNRLNGIGLVEGTRVTIGRIELLPGEIQLDLESRKLSDPNDLALVLLFALAFAGSHVALTFPKPSAILSGLGLCVIMLAIIFTQSRGGMLGVLTVLGVIGLRVVKSKVLLFGAGAVAVAFLAIAMDIGSRFDSGGAIDESSMGRLASWTAAVLMALDRPINGVGLQSFVSIMHEYVPLVTGRSLDVHSTWFAALAETGFPGLAVFVALYLAGLRSAYRSALTLDDRRAPPPALKVAALSLLAGLAGFGVSGAFLTQAFTWQIYINVALTAALTRVVAALPDEALRPSRATPARPTAPALRRRPGAPAPA